MVRVPTSALAAAGLVGGFTVARYSHNRRAGGAVWAAAGLLALPRWVATGPVRALALVAAYAGGMGASHPLAKKIGAWPSVLVVTAGTSALCRALADRS
jgi:hypothetical protein